MFFSITYKKNRQKVINDEEDLHNSQMILRMGSFKFQPILSGFRFKILGNLDIRVKGGIGLGGTGFKQHRRLILIQKSLRFKYTHNFWINLKIIYICIYIYIYIHIYIHRC